MQAAETRVKSPASTRASTAFRKVDWEMWSRTDLQMEKEFALGGPRFLTAMKAEIKDTMLQDADLAKVKQKLAERSNPVDLLNP